MDFTNYHEAFAAAQDKANRLGILVRLYKVNEYGRRGYQFRMVPSIERQFGCDLVGELIRPEAPDEA